MFERLKATMARSVIASMKKDYDADWFLRVLKLANDEDTGANVQYVTDAMKQNAWVNLAVTSIARNFSRAPFVLYKGEDVIEEGPAWELFNNPNPYLSRYQLWEATVSWRKARGEAFWIYEKDNNPLRGGIPTMIVIVDPSRMKHILDPDGQKITGWKYTQDKEEVPFLPKEVVHFRVWNKWDAWRGVSPLIAMGEELTQDWQANISNTKMISNGSVPRGILTSKQRLTENQAKELQDRWEKAHGGASRAHRVAVLGAETQYQQIGLSPEDLQYFEGKKWTRQTVLATYGIPPAVVGVKDDMTPLSGADTKEQLRSFWSMTLVSEQKAIEDKLRIDFFKRLGLEDLRGEFDIGDIPELKDDEAQRSTIDLAEIGAGVRTINEIRDERGLDPVEWGNVWWAPLMLQPISSEEVEEPEPVVAPPPPADGEPVQEPEEEPEPGEGPEPEAPEEPEEEAAGLRTAWGDVAGRASVGQAPTKAAPDLLTEASTVPLRRTAWPSQWRDKYWWAQTKRWDGIESGLRKALKGWLYRQRARVLEMLYRGGVAENTKGNVEDSAFWANELEELKKAVKPYLKAGMDAEGREAAQLMEAMGIQVGVSFNIWDTTAAEKLDHRVNQGHLADVTDTVRGALRGQVASAIEEGWTEDELAEGIRLYYDDSRSRMNTIARTELGGALNDARFSAYEYEGVEWHSWLSARDDFVRRPPEKGGTSDYDHDIDGEEVKLGEEFTNGLKYPNDDTGTRSDPGNVINCRCVTLPELKEGKPTAAPEGEPSAPSDVAFDETAGVDIDQWWQENVVNAGGHDWRESIPLEHRLAMGEYKGNYYGQTNDYLRYGLSRVDANQAERALKRTKLLDEVFAKGSFADNKTYKVYRAINPSAADIVFGPGGPKIGTIIQDKAFVSTSLRPSMVRSWGELRLEIEIPSVKGKAIFIESASLDREAELLLQRGQRFEIVGKGEVAVGRDLKMEVIRMKMIPTEVESLPIAIGASEDAEGIKAKKPRKERFTWEKDDIIVVRKR